jgi:hypothetical protein
MEQEEKWKPAAISMASDIKVQTFGGAEKINQTDEDMEKVQTIINNWNAMSKKSANLTIEQYGPPNEAIPSRLIWYSNGPWKRTIVYREKSHMIFHNLMPMLSSKLLIIRSPKRCLMSLRSLMVV